MARKTHKNDVYRLGLEMQARGYTVWEHSKFGGVNPRAHIRNSKHLRDEAIDLNYRPQVPSSRAEDDRFDRLALELVARDFGAIWNRGPGDHTAHLHAETYGNPVQYEGRVRLKRPVKWRRLVEDGTLGPQTIMAMQEWLGTPVDGVISRPSTMVKALQRYLNTEARRNVLVVDGLLGPKTISELQRYLGTPVTGKYSARGSTMWREVQRRLNARGHIAG